MNVVGSLLRAPDLAGSPAVRWTPFGRRAAAAILVLAASCQLAAFLIEVQHSNTIDASAVLLAGRFARVG